VRIINDQTDPLSEWHPADEEIVLRFERVSECGHSHFAEFAFGFSIDDAHLPTPS
jgi:hypothetical protein